MLSVGLTGGIGSGKSTVASRLVALGAVLVDADRIAREVVAAGSEGLARIVEAFGPEVVGADGELDRPRMAAVVFADPAARDRLNAIVHPLVRAGSAAQVAAAPSDAIVVQDVPLLVEGGMGAGFALVVVVHADEEVRVERLVGSRGMAEDDARARIRAQASDAQRRAAADVLLDNSGSAADLHARVDALWTGRLVPFRDNLVAGRPAVGAAGAAGDEDDAAAAARLLARVRAAVGESGDVEPAVSPAGDGVVELRVRLTDPAAPALAEAFARRGFVPDGDGGWASADPGLPARVRTSGRAG